MDTKQKGARLIALNIAGIALGIVIIGGLLAALFYPIFDGNFSNWDGSTKVVIVDNSGSLEVTLLTRNDAKDGQPQHFNARRDLYSLDFGTNLDRHSIVFHPFSNSPHNYSLVSGCSTIPLTRQTWLGTFATAHPYIVASLAAIIVLIFMAAALEKRAKIEPKLIYPTWLAFFAAFFISTAVLIAAGEAKIYDYAGNPLNEVARAILNVIEFMVDIEHETLLLAGALFVLALPQWCAYLMSGFTGAARRPRFIKSAWRISTVLLAKSFIGASAVAMSIVVVGNHYGWINSDSRNIIANLLSQLLLLVYGLVILFFVPPSKKMKDGNVPIRPRLALFHRFMTRRLHHGRKTAAAKRGQPATQTEPVNQRS
ncbi:hypothetical protein [Burkholderia ubonensis]|uniref:hypothetical protein n=1 Tax=Burkholderia ubonensis TaxID=101571 RepID=UPI000ABD9494|nr:hypothetical protein [Burkholderia ubonensis]